MGGPGSGRRNGAVAKKTPRITLASLAAVVEAQRGELAVLRARVATLEGTAAAAAAGTTLQAGAGGGAVICDRNVRRKTTTGSAPAAAPAATLETLPRDALHALASHLGVEDQARLMQSCTALREGLRGAFAPSEVILHGSNSGFSFHLPLKPAGDILSAPVTTKLGYICRRLREPGAARRLRSLRGFLWEQFCVEAPEIEALLRECSALKVLEVLEIQMPHSKHRTSDFLRPHLAWGKRLFDAAPSGLTTLMAPIYPALPDADGEAAFARFKTLEHLKLTLRSAPYNHANDAPTEVHAVQMILANLPLRSLTLRVNGGFFYSNFELKSDTLGTFVITGSKYAYVTSYQCPKLKNLSIVDLWHNVGHGENNDGMCAWDALKAGVHSLNLSTSPACGSSKIHFAEGVFNFNKYEKSRYDMI